MATELRTITKTVDMELLLTEVNADATISGQPAVCSEIIFVEPDQYTFVFDVTLNAGSDAALDAVIAAHNPFGGGGDPTGGFKTKAGIIAAGSFTGTPKTATVTFTNAYEANEDYAIAFSVIVSNSKTQYIPIVSSKSTTGFDVSLGTGSTSNLVEVHWHSLAVGEET